MNRTKRLNLTAWRSGLCVVCGKNRSGRYTCNFCIQGVSSWGWLVDKAPHSAHAIVLQLDAGLMDYEYSDTPPACIENIKPDVVIGSNPGPAEPSMSLSAYAHYCGLTLAQLEREIGE